MLSIFLGTKHCSDSNVISNTSGYFDAMYESTWFKSTMAENILKTIDGAKYISGEYIESRYGTGMSPVDLSTGCKTLLLLLNMPDIIVSGDRMGDNCYPVLLAMAKESDYYITLGHWVNFKPWEPFEVRNAENGQILKSALEVADAYIDGTYGTSERKLEDIAMSISD